MRSYPATVPLLPLEAPPAAGTATARAGVRSRTVITIRSGQDLLTCADWTWVMASTRRAAAAVSTRIMGWSDGMAAAARTWAAGPGGSR